MEVVKNSAGICSVFCIVEKSAGFHAFSGESIGYMVVDEVLASALMRANSSSCLHAPLSPA